MTNPLVLTIDGNNTDSVVLVIVIVGGVIVDSRSCKVRDPKSWSFQIWGSALRLATLNSSQKLMRFRWRAALT